MVQYLEVINNKFGTSVRMTLSELDDVEALYEALREIKREILRREHARTTDSN